MQDRVPVNPGRVLITPENGSAAYYATMTRADNPTQEGTPLNKASLLKDATAALFGLGSSAVPDDVLVLIKSLIDAANTHADTKAKIATGSYTGTGTYGDANANSLTFDFVPKVFFVSDAEGIRCSLPWLNGQTVGYVADSDISNILGGSAMTLSWNGNTISWYQASVKRQLNDAGKTYPYVAIG